MSQIETMVSWLPTDYLIYITHITVIVSLLAIILLSVFKKIPVVDNYARVLQPLFLVFFIVGVFFEGSLYQKTSYSKKIAEMEKKVKDAEEKSRQVNEVIKYVFIDKVKVIQQKGEDNVKYIETVVTKYDNLCTLSNAAVWVHNSASQNKVATGAGRTDEGTSDVKISELLKTVTDNYTTYYQTREQVIGWQEWYKEQKKIFESVK